MLARTAKSCVGHRRRHGQNVPCSVVQRDRLHCFDQCLREGHRAATATPPTWGCHGRTVGRVAGTPLPWPRQGRRQGRRGPCASAWPWLSRLVGHRPLSRRHMTRTRCQGLKAVAATRWCSNWGWSDCDKCRESVRPSTLARACGAQLFDWYGKLHAVISACEEGREPRRAFDVGAELRWQM